MDNNIHDLLELKRTTIECTKVYSETENHNCHSRCFVTGCDAPTGTQRHPSHE